MSPDPSGTRSVREEGETPSVVTDVALTIPNGDERCPQCADLVGLHNGIKAIDCLIKLARMTVAQRMKVMGMEPLTVALGSQEGQMQELRTAWVEAEDSYVLVPKGDGCPVCGATFDTDTELQEHFDVC